MLPQFCHTLSVLLILAPLSGAASETEWSTKGDFKLKAVKVGKTDWAKPPQRWMKTRDFELSEPGFDRQHHTLRLTIQGKSKLDKLLSLIASVEAPVNGYDAVHWKARVKPPAPASTLTVGEIVAWIKATPNQPHAIGRYQIIPDTLAYLVKAEAVRSSDVFTPALQDRLAIRLLKNAGLLAFQKGDMTRAEFMDSVAKVWAGLPLSSGKSAYDGYAGNRAIITRKEYASAFARIYP